MSLCASKSSAFVLNFIAVGRVAHPEFVESKFLSWLTQSGKGKDGPAHILEDRGPSEAGFGHASPSNI